jgi:parallel beta-helix repeat protein
VRSTAVLAAAAAAVLGLQSAASAHDHSTVYVSATGHGSGECRHPDATTIQQGVNRAGPGGTVVVCAGTYQESVTITTSRSTLHGMHGAVIDASGQVYGVGIGADRVTVTGLTVKNAGVGHPDAAKCGAEPDSSGPHPVCAGIVTFASAGGPPVPGNRLTITDNELTANLGFGIDVVSTHDSDIEDNEASHNGLVGINVVDDLNIPVRDNRIVGNVADDNATGCGIALASHTGAGVIGNLVKDNEADRNGLAGGGAGVLLATPIPTGKVQNNRLVDNSVTGNGHSGIQVHFHVPSATVDGNSIIGNSIGRNNVKGDATAGDPDTTGILIGSNSPLSILVRGNSISHDGVGIFVAGPNVSLHSQGNSFRDVQIRVKTSPVFN